MAGSRKIHLSTAPDDIVEVDDSEFDDLARQGFVLPDDIKKVEADRKAKADADKKAADKAAADKKE